MKIRIFENSEQLGVAAATQAAEILNNAIAEKGKARLVVATGLSQIKTIKALVKMPVAWEKVEMFHLDEYLGMQETHPASFRKYLKERFVEPSGIRKAYYVSAEGNVDENIRKLTEEIRTAPIDLGLIGIGENAHIAFNDPPANFMTEEAYIVVELDEDCKKQQMGEGWFATLEDVPKQAVTMTVYQIMKSKVIISCVPYTVKAEAVKKTLENDVTERIPATILKTHENWNLFLDNDSASLINRSLLSKYLE